MLGCKWPDEPHAHLDVERYPSAEGAQRGISDSWTVDGAVWGKTMSTTNDEGTRAERWWTYAGSPFVISISGTKEAVESVSNEISFRTPQQVASGHSA